ncbi:MAG: hypothetical protein RIF32_17005 [Leptospirales bacterium]
MERNHHTNFRKRIFGLIFFGVAAAALLAIALQFAPAAGMHAHSLHGSRPTAPPGDFTLTVYAIGAWAGEFDVDADGRGGLAALHTLVERERREARVGDRGGILLVQSGDFTGAQNAAGLRSKLEYPGLNLPRYLRIDALGPAAAETLAYAGLKKKRAPGILTTPAVSFNLRRALATEQSRAERTLDPFRLVRRGPYTALITAVTSGAEPRFETDPIDLLAGEFRRQDGVDLYVLLLDRKADATPDPVVDTHNLHDAAPVTTKPAYLNAIELLQRSKFWESFFPAAPGSTPDPYALPDSAFAQQWLIVESSAKRNHFRRLPEGPYLCSIADHAVCEISVEFRQRRVRGVRARFIHLNGARSSGGWLTPDPILLQSLKKRT